jgi:hypothetical protein
MLHFLPILTDFNALTRLGKEKTSWTSSLGNFLKTTITRKKPFSGTWRRVVLVGVEVSEERVASIFMVQRIRVLRTTLAITSNEQQAVW